MDTLKAVNGYLDKMFGEVPGMKVLLLDGHTVRPSRRALARPPSASARAATADC